MIRQGEGTRPPLGRGRSPTAFTPPRALARARFCPADGHRMRGGHAGLISPHEVPDPLCGQRSGRRVARNERRNGAPGNRSSAGRSPAAWRACARANRGPRSGRRPCSTTSCAGSRASACAASAPRIPSTRRRWCTRPTCGSSASRTSTRDPRRLLRRRVEHDVARARRLRPRADAPEARRRRAAGSARGGRAVPVRPRRGRGAGARRGARRACGRCSRAPRSSSRCTSSAASRWRRSPTTSVFRRKPCSATGRRLAPGCARKSAGALSHPDRGRTAPAVARPPKHARREQMTAPSSPEPLGRGSPTFSTAPSLSRPPSARAWLASRTPATSRPRARSRGDAREPRRRERTLELEERLLAEPGRRRSSRAGHRDRSVPRPPLPRPRRNGRGLSRRARRRGYEHLVAIKLLRPRSPAPSRAHVSDASSASWRG